MSQAEAWQTTSRSRGLVIIERSQNVSGSGAKPSELKKPSPVGPSAPACSSARSSSWVEVVAAPPAPGGATTS